MRHEKLTRSCELQRKCRVARLAKVFLMLLSTFTFLLSTLHAQEAIPATGGNASGSGGSVSYSVGQLVYTTNMGTNSSVAQGVQQPYEISVGTGIEEAKGLALQCSAYPNPATDFLMLTVEGCAETDNYLSLRASLYDMTGKILKTTIIKGSETPLSMKNLDHATYFLKVTDNNKEVKTFKIIKN